MCFVCLFVVALVGGVLCFVFVFLMFWCFGAGVGVGVGWMLIGCWCHVLSVDGREVLVLVLGLVYTNLSCWCWCLGYLFVLLTSGHPRLIALVSCLVCLLGKETGSTALPLVSAVAELFDTPPLPAHAHTSYDTHRLFSFVFCWQVHGRIRVCDEPQRRASRERYRGFQNADGNLPRRDGLLAGRRGRSLGGPHSHQR